MIGGGGLTDLGMTLPTLRKNYIPEGYAKNWTPNRYIDGRVYIDLGAGPVLLSHNSHRFSSQSANVPKNELVIAYGATIAMTSSLMTDAMLKAGFTAREIAQMTPEARRVWEAMFFAMPGGKSNQAFEKTKNWQEIGGVTLVERLEERIRKGQSHGLDDILTDPEFDRFKNVRLAKVASANAAMIEMMTGLPDDPTGDCFASRNSEARKPVVNSGF